jgi:hypothetical protein
MKSKILLVLFGLSLLNCNKNPTTENPAAGANGGRDGFANAKRGADRAEFARLSRKI